jgi:hypothetical protein
MTSALARHSDPDYISRALLAPDTSPSTERLGEAIAELAARLHAATYELLVLLRAFVAGAGWNHGFLSCAHWLHWRTGIDLGAAREKVRVAKALAITRVATPANEAALVDLALAGTAAHVERFVRAWRRVDRVQEARETEARHLRRELSTWVDDDGMVVIRGRLTPELGAVVQRALDAAADRLFREGAMTPTGDALAEEVTPGQRRADALGLVAETALAADLDRGTAGDRYQVVVHVDASQPAAVRAREATADAPAPDAAVTESRTFDGTLEVADGATYVSAETSRRIACDASRVVMRHDTAGAVLDVGRKTRTIPSAIRRALLARDTRCRFPGCTARRCDAHHIEQWADGGPTCLENLVLLCRRHHRGVHEGGFTLTTHPDGSTTVRRPDGARIEAAPVLPILDATPDRYARDTVAAVAAGTAPVWDGTPFDVTWALDVVRGSIRTPGTSV